MPKKTIDAETVAEAYLILLAERGIEHLFVNGGTDFAPIVEALAAIEAKGAPLINVVSVPHENVAVSMAHGYYLMTGRPQSVMFHVNVGTANGISALANAARDNIPMLFTAGRNPLSEKGRTGSRDTGIHWGQEMFDQAGMVRELVKWDYELRDGGQLEGVIDRALEIATAEPCGPVYLTLPREVMSAPVGAFSYTAPARHVTGMTPGVDARAVEAAADLLADAEFPLIMPRACARTAADAAALSEFAETFAMPVIEYRALANAIAADHAMNLGFDPMPHLREADAILSVESDVPWIPDRHGDPPEDCAVVHLGYDPLFQRIPIRGFRCDAAVQGAPALALPALGAALAARGAGDGARIARRRDRVAAARQAMQAESEAILARVANETPIHPAWASHCIAEARDPDSIVINEYPVISRFAPFSRPRTYFGTPAGGGLGWGIGAALGAKLALPDRLVIAALGDGAYMFGNPTAGHQVARAYDLPILFIVFNNGRWEEVERAALSIFPDGHAARANRIPVAELGPTASFEHMMAVYDGYGERVGRPDELPAALERAIRAVTVERRQALLNLIVGHR